MRVIASLCLVVVLASCGVGGQSNAHVFDAAEVPYGLTDTAPPPTVGVAQAPFVSTTVASASYDLYFIRSGILVAVTRRATTPPSSADLVNTLVVGPTQAEVNAGHRSALTGLEVATRTRDGAASVVVDLGRTFNDIPRSDRIFALGQITLTLTARTGVTSVQYTIADTPIEVPKANGVVTRDPVSQADYSSLLVAPTSSTTTTTVSPPTSSPAPATS